MPARSASHRLRIGRYAEQNRIYLLTANTLEREPVFKDYRLGRVVIHQFRAVHEQGIADSLAFVVMPDHVHWLIRLHRGSLGQLMCQVKSISAKGSTRRLIGLVAYGSRDITIERYGGKRTW